VACARPRRALKRCHHSRLNRTERWEQKCQLCRLGRSYEPAKAGGATVISRASGFLGTEACTTRDLAARLGFTLAQTSLRKPSRAKQDLGDLSVGSEEVQDALTACLVVI